MRVALFKETRVPEVYTMESTFCGADQGEFSGLHMTTAQLKSLGESLLLALLTKSGLAPTTDDPMPSPSDVCVPISLEAAMSELMSNEELLVDPEGDSDSGSDSDPSGDNLEVEELTKLVPIAQPKLGGAQERSLDRRRPKRKVIRSFRSMSASKPKDLVQKERRKCGNCGEPWSFRHKCEPPKPTPPPKPVSTRPSRSQLAKAVGVRTYYNSNGKKVHD
jgi:hypothetical protein